MKTSNVVLVIVGILTVAFIIEMIHMFYLFQNVPNQLIICFFSLVGGECGVLGWIKTAKVKHVERQQQLEDYERFKLDGKENSK